MPFQAKTEVYHYKFSAQKLDNFITFVQTQQNKIAGNGHGTKSDLFFNKKIGLIVFIQGHFFLHQDKNVKS